MNEFLEFCFLLIYFILALFVTYFILTDRKETKLSLFDSICWIFFSITPPFLGVPIYLFYRSKKLL